MIRNLDTNAGASDPIQGLIDHARVQTEHTRAVLNIAEPPPLPDSIPGYTILREAHRGGQGVVYEATQEGTRRRVAIKVVRDGALAGRPEQARFQREVEVLAQFKHPNIVQLYDGGVADGRLYYSMDFVDGRPFDTFVRETECSIRDTLQLIRKIASAVHAAHLKGIVHRDLKPGNIRIDAAGEPYVLDFGLAKLMNNDGAMPHGESITLTGQFMGSLPWAAPEQVDGSLDGVDIRTDIHALGVLLFHALTDRFPYEVVGPMRAVMDNIIHIQPPRPSTLQPGIDDDVDTIVLKCLSKDRERRYQSAGDLAQDIERYLKGEPIEAKRDSAWYLLTRVIRHHQRLAALIAVFLLLTLAYGVTMTGMYRRSRRSEAQSVHAKAKAENEARQLQSVLATFVDTASKRLGRIAGAEDVRRELNQLAFAQLIRLSDEQNGTPLVQRDLAESHRIIGDLADAIGDYTTAGEHFDKALKLRQELAETHSENLDYQADLSIALVRKGDIAALKGALEEQLHCYQRAMAIDEELVRREPINPTFVDNLAWSYDRVALIERSQGRLDVARQLHRDMSAIAESLVTAEPDNPTRLFTLFTAQSRLLHAAVDSGDWTTAVTDVDTAAQVARRIVELEPANPYFLPRVTKELIVFAWISTERDVPTHAKAIVDDAEILVERLVNLNLLPPMRIAEFVSVYSCRASISAKLGNIEAERRALARGVELLSIADRLAPGHSYIVGKLAQFKAANARLAFDAADMDAAIELGQEAVRLAHEAMKDRSAGEETLEACAAVLGGVHPTEYRDTTAAVTALERISLSPDFVESMDFLVAFTTHLAADGQVERARVIQERAFFQLPSEETYYRQRLLAPFAGNRTGEP